MDAATKRHCNRLHSAIDKNRITTVQSNNYGLCYVAHIASKAECDRLQRRLVAASTSALTTLTIRRQYILKSMAVYSGRYSNGFSRQQYPTQLQQQPNIVVVFACCLGVFNQRSILFLHSSCFDILSLRLFYLLIRCEHILQSHYYNRPLYVEYEHGNSVGYFLRHNIYFNYFYFSKFILKIYNRIYN